MLLARNHLHIWKSVVKQAYFQSVTFSMYVVSLACVVAVSVKRFLRLAVYKLTVVSSSHTI
jgi:hypothetical protein